MLADTLAMAVSGQLQSFVGCGFTSDHERFALWCTPANANVYEWLGSIAWLEHEYVHRTVMANPPDWTRDVPPDALA